MALTRPLLSQLNTNITSFSDNMMVINAGNVANRDLGMVFDRSVNSQSNVALFWQESSSSFTFAQTTSSGLNNANIVVGLTANVVLGNLILAGNGSAGIFYANGAVFGGSGGTPGGISGQLQYNNLGSFAGASGATFNGTNVSVTGFNVNTTATITTSITRNTRNVPTYVASASPPDSPLQGDVWYETTTDIVYKYINDGVTSVWVDQGFGTIFSTLTVTGNASVFGVVSVNSNSSPIAITNSGTNGVGNIGTTGATFNTIFAKATTAQYADLAENYLSDSNYTPGTVVVFDGEKEITVSSITHDTKVAGVISTNPGFLMNEAQLGGIPVAFTGRVPCKVQGPVNKGDVLVNVSPGVAGKLDISKYQPGCILGKSLEIIDENMIKEIEIVVGRF